VAVDELLDREGARVAALTNAETAQGVRLYVAHPATVLAGEPAPVVLLVHQVRPSSAHSAQRGRRQRPPSGTFALAADC
jgi:hypothetical protein